MVSFRDGLITGIKFQGEEEGFRGTSDEFFEEGVCRELEDRWEVQEFDRNEEVDLFEREWSIYRLLFYF